MPMLIPVRRRALNCLANLFPRVKVTAFEGQRPQNFPPWLDQIHVWRIFRLEHELPSRMPKGEEQHIRRPVSRQVVHHCVYTTHLWRNPRLDMFEKIDPVDAATALKWT